MDNRRTVRITGRRRTAVVHRAAGADPFTRIASFLRWQDVESVHDSLTYAQSSGVAVNDLPLTFGGSPPPRRDEEGFGESASIASSTARRTA